MMNDDERDNEYVDLFDLGWHDGYNDKLPDPDYCSSEEYMAGFSQGKMDC